MRQGQPIASVWIVAPNIMSRAAPFVPRATSLTILSVNLTDRLVLPRVNSIQIETRMVGFKISSKYETNNHYFQMCLCGKNERGCTDRRILTENDHLDYYSACQEIKQCEPEELTAFPRLSNLLFHRAFSYTNISI